METTTIINQFRVENPALKVSHRYRIVFGYFSLDDTMKTYWIEIYLPNSRRWSKVYKYAHWNEKKSMLMSDEFYKVFFNVI